MTFRFDPEPATPVPAPENRAPAPAALLPAQVAPRVLFHAGGWERCPPNQHLQLEPGEFCIELVTAGQGMLRSGGRSHALRPGLAVLFGPGGRYGRSSGATGPVCRLFVCFGGALAVARLRRMGLTAGGVICCETQRSFQTHLQDMIREGAVEPDRQAEAVEFHFDALLAAFASTGAVEASRAEGAHLTFLRCKAYLEEHYLRLRRVDEVAARFGIDPSYLCRLFARFSDVTPHRMYERLRIDHAARVLASRDVLVQDVAEMLGMDQFHFSRVFKRVYGVSPSTFQAKRDTGGEPSPVVLQGVA